MRIIAPGTLKRFGRDPRYVDAFEPLMAWYRVAKAADWVNPAAVKPSLRNASILREGRVVFNIAGNKYRLVVRINDDYGVVYVRFIGTHARYDVIDAQTV